MRAFHGISSLLFLIASGSISLAEEASTSVDLNFVTIIQEKLSDTSRTHFGYSTSLASGVSGSSGWVFVGAPKSNVSIAGRNPDYFEPGVIWRCHLGPNGQKCEVLHFLHELCKDQVVKENKQEKLNLGICDSILMGGSLTFENDVLVACAPNWKRERKGSTVGLRMDGACYWLKGSAALGSNLALELTQQTTANARGVLIPFKDSLYTDSNTHSWTLNKKHVLRWYFAAAGFSVHVSNKNEILIGAPTTHVDKGSMIRMDEPEYKHWSLVNLETYKDPELRKFEHFGYGITSGNYYDRHVIDYAASSPLGGASASGWDFVGVVLIVEAKSFLNSTKIPKQTDNELPLWTQKDIIKGTYFGAYFGAALESLDINNDGLDDLVVGAPFEENIGRTTSSPTRTPMKEHGCIYIYGVKGPEKFKKPAKFCGMDAGGWFGSSIAKLGDLNQDGYNDFAVGAPNDEDGGSVHIFYGSQNLLDLKKIVIKAKYYNPSFSSFGFSISRGVDIDGNGTPDFSIGSYADKNVVIFRTRPMMKIIHSMYSYINTKAEDPVTLGKDVRQFTIELCATISVVSNNKTLKLSPKNGTVIHAKITIDEMEPGKRFTINGETVTLTQFVFSAAETPLCSQFSLERISIPPSDQLEGQADVTVKYMLWYNETTKASPLISAFQIKNQNNVPEIVASVNSTANFTDFCSNCPYPISTDPELLYITFKKDCRRRNENGTIPVCQPKLSVTITGKFGDCNNFSRSLSGTQNQLILGDTPCLEIYVQVKNSHQVAFSPRIKLHWGWDSSVLALPDLEGKGDLCDIQNNSAICRLDRVRLYLGTNKTQTQDFKLDMQKLDPVDSNPKRLVVDAAVDLESDNEFQPVRSSLAINYKVDANIDLMEGGLSNNSFPVPKDGQMSYHFKARLAGSTPVKGTIKFLLPESILWNGRTIKMFSINKPKILDCVPNSVDDPDFKIYDTKVRQGKGSFGSLYGKSECQAWNCSFYVPGKSRFLDMRFGVRLLDRKLTREILLKEGTLDFYGMAHAKILELMPRANFTRIIINPPDNSGLPGWVILLAVVGGLLFLFLIIFALNKCGFFKRNVKERLEQMKAQTEEDIELDEADAKTPLEGGEDKSKYSTFD